MCDQKVVTSEEETNLEAFLSQCCLLAHGRDRMEGTNLCFVMCDIMRIGGW